MIRGVCARYTRLTLANFPARLRRGPRHQNLSHERSECEPDRAKQQIAEFSVSSRMPLIQQTLSLVAVVLLLASCNANPPAKTAAPVAQNTYVNPDQCASCHA